MLAKISSGKSVFGILQYNKIKVDDEHAAVLYRQKMFDSPDSKFSIKDCMDSFYPYLALNQRTEKVVFHVSLNPDPKNRLSDEQLSEIAQVYMDKLGYGNQPYIILKHSDIKREHFHIISLRIDENGRKINDSYEAARSMKICKELEDEFKLVPLKKGERQEEIPIRKIDYKVGDIKHQVGNITKAVMNHFYFQSFGEYRTILEQFNITAEEIKGKHNGILYSVTDDKGNKTGRPFKSSLFGKETGYEALQKHYENSKRVVGKKNIREQLRPVIAQSMRQTKNINDFRLLLKKKNIGVIFLQNETGRIYGVTFIDYPNRAVLNGSRLGKEFSANVFNDLFNSSQKQNITSGHMEEKQTDINRDSAPGSVFGLLDMPQSSGSDYEEEVFIREQEYEAKRRRLKAKKKGRRL
ncbi:MAG: relaxase/mobilization nuclease domain-containing protein [Prevotellaceae bacterium]|jgi:hypothetical protein|nr:relaxase/mobilization nuclease domain-containing protein [Prevotellaceae bacterium]